MADKKISQLTAATTPLAGTEVFPIVQSSATVKATIANVQAAPVSAGTANAVQYLNGSKVPTTGSALYFNGTSLGLSTATPDPFGWGTSVGINNASYSAVSFKVADTGKAYVAAGTGAMYIGGPVPLIFYSGTTGTGNEGFRLDTALDITVKSGNIVQGTAAKGINFTANTPAAGMTSQLLNWYEEGTWTATMVSNGGTDPTNPVTATGYYSRIGKRVFFNVFFSNVNTTGGVGPVKVTGLPFTPNVTSGGVCIPFNFDLNGGTSVGCSIESTGIFPLVAVDDAGWVGLQFGAGAGRYMHLTGNYTVA